MFLGERISHSAPYRPSIAYEIVETVMGRFFLHQPVHERSLDIRSSLRSEWYRALFWASIEVDSAGGICFCARHLDPVFGESFAACIPEVLTFFDDDPTSPWIDIHQAQSPFG